MELSKRMKDLNEMLESYNLYCEQREDGQLHVQLIKRPNRNYGYSSIFKDDGVCKISNLAARIIDHYNAHYLMEYI